MERVYTNMHIYTRCTLYHKPSIWLITPALYVEFEKHTHSEEKQQPEKINNH